MSDEGEIARATPLARSAARQKQIDLASVVSGDAQRIIRLEDVARTSTVEVRPPHGLAAGQSSGALGRSMRRQLGHRRPQPLRLEPAQARERTVDLDGKGFPPSNIRALTPMRRVIAERLSASKASAPHYYMSMDVDMDALIATRASLNHALAPTQRLSLNDLFIKLIADTLIRHPGLNSAWTGDAIATFEDVNLAIAVAIDGGLVTPVLRNAGKLGLREINARMTTMLDDRTRQTIGRRGVRRRHFHGIQPRHVRGQGVRRHHQSAAGSHSRHRRDPQGAAATR